MRGWMAGAALSLGMATSGSALAQSLAWQVTEVSGPVSIRHGADQRMATRGATLAPGDVIATAAGGRAVMVHDKDFVTLAANSRATVPGAAEQASGFTKLLQDLGNAVYKIEKRGVPHFGVTTPYLAAVVKGTTFSITVDDRGSTLQVVEGAVEVTTPDGGARDLILPAGVATVAATDRYRLSVHGDHERVIDSPARPPAAAASSGGAGPAKTAAARPAAQPTPATVATAAVEPEGGDVIAVPVASRPVDMAAFTGGLVTGTAGFTALTATVTQATKAPDATAAAVHGVAAAVPTAQPPIVAAAAPVAVTANPAAAAATPSTVAVGPAAVVATSPAVTAPTTAPAPTPTPTVTPVPAPVAPPLPATPVATPATPPLPAAPVVTPPAVVPPAAVTPPVVTTPAATTPVVTTSPAFSLPVIPVVTTIGTVISSAAGVLTGDDSGKGNNGNHFGWTKGNGKLGR